MKAHLVYAVLLASSLITPVFAAPERGWLAPEFKDRYENRFWLWELFPICGVSTGYSDPQ
jgi:hypothetical protein